MRRSNLLLCFAFLLVVLASSAVAQSQAVETGKFRLHKFEQPIGEETYTIKQEKDGLIVSSTFLFTDRGTEVPLKAELRTRSDLTPISFDIEGSVSRFSTIDSSVEIKDNQALITENKTTRHTTVPTRFFTISGYAPTVMQMMLVRYIQRHKLTGPVATLPNGDVTLELRGKDKIKIAGKDVELDRYSISNLIWGRESLWFDSAQNLVAVVTVDGEFDHFESIREGYESGLSFFVLKAVADGMQRLAEFSRKVSPDPKTAIVISGATLIDGNGGPPIPDSVVVIEGDRIIAAGPRDNVVVPKRAKVIEARGKFLLPGLWDMHAHFEQVEWGPTYLAAGVTTVRDVGNEFEFITAVRDALNAGQSLGPRMLLAGIIDGESNTSWGIIRASAAAEAEAAVNRYHKAGFQQIKIYSSVEPPIIEAICAAAHKLGMTVTGHVPTGLNAIQAVEAGMDQINHVEYLLPVLRPRTFRPLQGAPAPPLDFKSPEAQRAIEFFKSHNTVIDPTLAVFEWTLHSAEKPFSSIEPGAGKLPRQLNGQINNTGVPASAAPQTAAILDRFYSIVGALHKAGIPIVAGTDQVVPGFSLYREIELYVKSGFTPMEAIQAATIVPARVMKLDKESGTIAAGKRADILVLDRDPLDNIRNIRTGKTVIAAGRIYDTAQLWQSMGFKP
ncbi:MAG TPA: amidohydrolase family protein [Pyrinomonadaceae bacterium]|nr:amidohydrolase family protein [Pyrinomonadaceae bacterium]